MKLATRAGILARHTACLIFSLTVLFCCSAARGQQTGSLRVLITPVSAVEQGAMWRRTGTQTWFLNDQIESDIPTGRYTVEYNQLPFWYQVPTQTVYILEDKTARLDVTYSPKPIPGPDFLGCRLINYGTQPYAPLPLIDIMQLGSPVQSWPEGSYDFCACMDTIYCSLPAIASQWDESLIEFADLILCVLADINGPLNSLEDVPFQANGIPDGAYELATVAYALNNPNHPLHLSTKDAFQYNFIVAKDIVVEALSLYEGDIRSIVRLIAPHLPSALATLLAAYATLGDEQTFEAMDELFSFLRYIGIEPIEGGIRSISLSVPALGPDGDANNDGFTNGQAYYWYVGEQGFAPDAYVHAVMEESSPLELLEVHGGGVYLTGSTVLLEAEINGAVPAEIAWSKDGFLLAGEEGLDLVLEDSEVEDTGVYCVDVLAELTFDSGNTACLTASTQVEILGPDTTPPVILTCPDDTTVDVGEACTVALPDFTSLLTAEDDRTAQEQLTVLQTPEAGTNFAADTCQVCLQVFDESNNSSQCFFEFIVMDRIPPEITFCPAPVTLFLDDSDSIIMPDMTTWIAVLDNCDPNEILSITQIPEEGTALQKGLHPVEIRVEDNSGNATQCQTEVLVLDKLPPAEGEGEALAEGEGEVPAEGEGEALAEGEGEVLAEGEGEEDFCGCGCDRQKSLPEGIKRQLGDFLLLGVTLFYLTGILRLKHLL